MKKITLLTLLLSVCSFAQVTTVTLIDPAGDGGFETGTTLEANGWTTAQVTGANKKWYVGTGQAGYTGQRAAFIGNSETNVGGGNPSRIVHFYRQVTFPADATNIVLTFKYKQAVTDFFDGEPYDYIQVNTAAAIPVNATDAPGQVRFGPYPADDAGVPTFTTQTVTLPNNMAGQTRYLIFTFHGDAVEPNGMGAVDDISLTYDMPAASAADFKKAKLSYHPNPVNDMLNLSYPEALTSVQIYNVLGQEVLTKKLSTNEAHIDMSSLKGGIYIVKAISASGASKTIKITKK